MIVKTPKINCFASISTNSNAKARQTVNVFTLEGGNGVQYTVIVIDESENLNYGTNEALNGDY